jgi:hypothetical protein
LRGAENSVQKLVVGALALTAGSTLVLQGKQQRV